MTDNISHLPNSALLHQHSNYSSAKTQDKHYTIDLPLPGAAGHIAEHLYNNSIYPDEGACQLAALSALAGIAGHNNFAPTRLKLNLYVGFVMPSGFGKDRIKDGITDALELLGMRHRMVSPAASRQSLHKELNVMEVEELIRSRQWSGDDVHERAEQTIIEGGGVPTTAVMVADEFHSILQIDEKAPHKKERRDMLLEAYTAKKAIYGIKSLASPLPPITQTHFNLIGFSTPLEMIMALGENSAGSGLAGRFIFYTLQKRPQKNYDNMEDKPLELTRKQLEELYLISGKEKRIVPWGKGAFEYWKDLDEKFIEPMKDEQESGEIANRLSEHVIKISSLTALAKNPKNPEIDIVDIDRAWQMRLALHANFVNMLRQEGGLGASNEATLATKIERRIFDICTRYGQVSRSRLSQICADFRKISVIHQDLILSRIQKEGKIFLAETGRGQSITWVEKQE